MVTIVLVGALPCNARSRTEESEAVQVARRIEPADTRDLHDARGDDQLDRRDYRDGTASETQRISWLLRA